MKMEMEMAALYDVNVRTINEHIKKIHSDVVFDQLHTLLNRNRRD